MPQSGSCSVLLSHTVELLIFNLPGLKHLMMQHIDRLRDVEKQLQALKTALEAAVAGKEYEEAARLTKEVESYTKERDELRNMKFQGTSLSPADSIQASSYKVCSCYDRHHFLAPLWRFH